MYDTLRPGFYAATQKENNGRWALHRTKNGKLAEVTCIVLHAHMKELKTLRITLPEGKETCILIGNCLVETIYHHDYERHLQKRFLVSLQKRVLQKRLFKNVVCWSDRESKL